MRRPARLSAQSAAELWIQQFHAAGCRCRVSPQSGSGASNLTRFFWLLMTLRPLVAHNATV